MAHLILIEPEQAYRAVLSALLETLGWEVRGVCSWDAARAAGLAECAGIMAAWEPANPASLDAVRSFRQVVGAKATPVVLLADSATRAEVIEAASVGIQGILLRESLTLPRVRLALKRAIPEGSPGNRAAGILHAAPAPAGPAPKPSPEPAQADASPPVAPPPAAPGEGPSACEPGSLKDYKPMVTRSEVIERLSALQEMRVLSPTVAQILSLTKRPDCSLAQVSTVVSHDQSMSLKLLKLANTAVYSRGEPVTSVRDAVLRIGLERIRQAVATVSVIDQFGTTEVTDRFNFVHFWEHSICCGVLAGAIGEAIGCMDRDHGFTLGLLHDIGRLLLTECFPEEYDHLLDLAHALQLPVEQVESRLFLLNHAAVLDRLLHAWGFSKQLIGPLTNHHLSAANLREHAGAQLHESAVLALANRLTHALMIGSSGNEVLYPTESLCKLLNVNEKPLAAALAAAEDETQQIKLCLMSAGSLHPWGRVLDRYRESIGCAFRPLYIGDDTPLDAFAIACGRLADISDEPPNLAVLRLEAARQAVRLGTLLATREEELRLDPLPTLILSPNGQLTLDHGQMSRRRTAQLPTPVLIPRFLSTIRDLLEASAPATALTSAAA